MKRASSVMVSMLFIISLLFMTLGQRSVRAWSNGGYSTDPSNPNYGTHDWIAQHALDWLPDGEKQCFLDNLAAYLYGTELPDNGGAPDGIGDTVYHHLYFNEYGIMTDDWAAFRASWEYERAKFFLTSGDLANAAKTAGIMSHYLADVAVFGHVMAAGTVWGAETHHADYETYVNERTNSYNDDFNFYLSFDGNLDLTSAYNATKSLAYDTTFDPDGDLACVGGLTCVWMDQNYDWNDPVFRNRAGESLNLAVNYLADVLHTLIIETADGAEEITVFPAADVGVVFESITEEGTTTADRIETGPAPPPACVVKKYYDIGTTASYSGTIDVKIIYDRETEEGVGVDVSPEEEVTLQLMIWNEITYQWTDITTYIDTKNDLVVGETTHLSIFGVTCSVIDAISPATSLIIGSPQYSGAGGAMYVTSMTPLSLLATDNLGGSGVASSAFRIRNATYDSGWLTYTASFNLSGLLDGEYSIDYFSTDTLGNTETTNTAIVILDNTPPTTTLTIGEPKYISDTTYVTPDTPFTLEATDLESGVCHIACRIYSATYDGGWTACDGIFSLSLYPNGNYIVVYNCTDNVGNMERKEILIALVRGYDAPGDLTGDGKVDIYDVVKIAIIYGSRVGSENWNPLLDFDNDGVISIFDIATCIFYWKP